jgi:hypothetical protein
MGTWGMKGVKGNTKQGMSTVCYKEEGCSHILRCEEIRNWREEMLDKRFTSTQPERGTLKTAINKGYDKLQRVGLYLSRYKANCKKPVMKYDEV